MRLIPAILLTLGLCHAEEIRTWTDAQDRKVEATLLRIEDQSVILRLKDGREVPYPLTKLSEADRKHVAESRASLSGNKVLPEGADIGKKFNFNDPWPERIKFTEDPEINTVEENPEKKSFIYESANYRYVCDVRLTKSVVKGFAVMFEATHLYCRTLPLAFNGGTKMDGKHLILLFEKFDDYVKAGGPASSAGVFISGKNAVLVPLDSIGVKPLGSGYMLDRDKSSNTIPHELTHQLSPEEYFAPGARGWFSEGIAEYVANTPYRSGTFSVRGNLKPIVDYVTSYGSKDMGGRALGTKIHLASLKGFMLQDYASFQEEAQVGYGCGLLVTTYFLHMDGDGDGKRIKAFLKALHEGEEGEKAIAHLLDGRTFEQLQEDFTKAWSRRGVDFTFGK
ncbi:MAG: SHD1 domain-containing protein [Verrucomicrobiota bacterium]